MQLHLGNFNKWQFNCGSDLMGVLDRGLSKPTLWANPNTLANWKTKQRPRVWKMSKCMCMRCICHRVSSRSVLNNSTQDFWLCPYQRAGGHVHVLVSVKNDFHLYADLLSEHALCALIAFLKYSTWHDCMLPDTVVCHSFQDHQPADFLGPQPSQLRWGPTPFQSSQKHGGARRQNWEFTAVLVSFEDVYVCKFSTDPGSPHKQNQPLIWWPKGTPVVSVLWKTNPSVGIQAKLWFTVTNKKSFKLYFWSRQWQFIWSF